MKKQQVLLCLAALTLILSGCTDNGLEADAYGNFESDETTVSAKGNGEIISFEATEGVKIPTGKQVGMVDASGLHLKKKQLHAQANAVRTRLTNLNAQVEVQQQQLENLQTDKKRIQNLLNENAATQKQMDDLIAGEKLIQKQIRATKVQKQGVLAELDVISTQIDQIEENIKDHMIINPVEGTVMSVFVREGEVTAFGRPLYRIASLDTMTLKAYISGAQLPHIRIGQKVEVQIDEDEKSNTSLPGRVKWIASEAEFTPKTIQTKEERVKQVYAVEIAVPNDGSIKTGMPGELYFMNSQTNTPKQ